VFDEFFCRTLYVLFGVHRTSVPPGSPGAPWVDLNRRLASCQHELYSNFFIHDLRFRLLCGQDGKNLWRQFEKTEVLVLLLWQD